MKNRIKVIVSILLFCCVFLSVIYINMSKAFAYDNGSSLYSENRYDYRTRRNVIVNFNGGSATLSYKINVDRTSKNGIVQGMWIEGLGIGTLVKDIKGQYHYLRSWPNNQTPKEGTYKMEIDSIGVTPYLCFSHLYKKGYTYDGMSVTLSNNKSWKGSTQDLKNGVWGFGVGAKSTGWTMDMKSGTSLNNWLKDNPDIRFKVLWKANTYKIAYDGNGQTSGNTGDSFHTYDQANRLSKNKFNKEGYHFIGWSTSKDGPLVYKDEDLVVNLTDQKDKTVVLYAVWEADEYTNSITHILCDKNNTSLLNLGDTTFKVKNNDRFHLNNSMSIAVPKGFDISLSYRNVLDNKKGTLPVHYIQSNKPFKFEFYYVPKKYNIHYELNGGVNNASNPTTYTIMDSFTLSAPSKRGCEFLGWYLKDQLTSVIDNSKVLNFNSVTHAYESLENCLYGDIVLEAKWSLPKPIIESKVGYYYKGDQVSNQDVLKNVKAYDPYDGDLSDKVTIEYYRYSDDRIIYNPTFLDTSSTDSVYVMYKTTNSHNQTSKKEGMVIIVDKGSHVLENTIKPTIYTRFIGLKTCMDGTSPLNTLSLKSIWKSQDYYNVIIGSLNKTGDYYLKNYDYINTKTYKEQLRNR